MPTIVRSEQAKRDAAEIWHYIAEDNARAADRLIDQFSDKINLAPHFPGLGAKRDELSPGLRSIPVGSYLIFYRGLQDGIQVVRIVHGARNLRRLFKR